MISLLMFIGEYEQFDDEEVYRYLQEIPGVSELKRGCFVGAVLQCHYDFNGDSTIVRLSDDLGTITAAGTGDASLQVALELQRRETRPIRVTDFGYNFDLSLGDMHGLEEFRQKITAANVEEVEVT